MNCPKCNEQLIEEAIICGKCGTRLKGVQAKSRKGSLFSFKKRSSAGKSTRITACPACGSTIMPGIPCQICHDAATNRGMAMQDDMRTLGMNDLEGDSQERDAIPVEEPQNDQDIISSIASKPRPGDQSILGPVFKAQTPSEQHIHKGTKNNDEIKDDPRFKSETAISEMVDQDVNDETGLRATPYLLVNTEGHERRILLEGQEMYIGRARTNRIFLKDDQVSRQHAVIRRESVGYVIEDIGSTNGTFINGQEAKIHVLSNDDTVEVGDTKMVYKVPE